MPPPSPCLPSAKLHADLDPREEPGLRSSGRDTQAPHGHFLDARSVERPQTNKRTSGRHHDLRLRRIEAEFMVIISHLCLMPLLQTLESPPTIGD